MTIIFWKEIDFHEFSFRHRVNIIYMNPSSDMIYPYSAQSTTLYISHN